VAVNFSTSVYLIAQNLYGRPVTITPKSSQPNGPAYSTRGIFDIEAVDVQALDGSIVSETRVILDIRDDEFSVVPMQGDLVDVPADASGLPAHGLFEIIDRDPNGGGETTLTLRHIVQAKP
jgi:hypothetical protein